LAEYEKLRNDTALTPGMISEIIRWQTPLAVLQLWALGVPARTGVAGAEADKRGLCFAHTSL